VLATRDAVVYVEAEVVRVIDAATLAVRATQSVRRLRS